MVLMRVGDHQPDQLATPLRQPAGIGDHDLGFRRVGAAETDAAIHCEQGTVAAIHVQVEANFPGPSERDQGEAGGGFCHSVLVLINI